MLQKLLFSGLLVGFTLGLTSCQSFGRYYWPYEDDLEVVIEPNQNKEENYGQRTRESKERYLCIYKMGYSHDDLALRFVESSQHTLNSSNH